MKQFTLITVLLASIAVAQSLSGEMTVVVPFPFVVGGAVLPSGHYVIRDHGTYLQISSTQTRNVLVPTHDALRSESNGSKVVFRCYEGSCFFDSMWTTGQNRGRQLFPSSAEKELAKRRAQMNLAVLRPSN